MITSFSRRIRRRSTHETPVINKERNSDRAFFGNTIREAFFSPAAIVQRKCEECEKENKKMQRQTDKNEDKKITKKEDAPAVATSSNYVSTYINSINGKGESLPKHQQHFFGSRMGYDFGNVKIHTGKEAADSTRDVNAKAYTIGNNIVFNHGQYNTGSAEGKKLLAHELTHVMQQHRGNTLNLQRAVNFNVLNWDASAMGSPAPQNFTDTRLILIPSTDQVIVSGLVEANGTGTDNCADYEFGTTQTAWVAWCIQYYRGRNPGEGSITARYRATTPIRDPGVNGSIWYDNGRVRSTGFCGDAAGVFHNDGPWQAIPKARNNSSVAGSPLNYLTGYTRGLHLVTYLAGKQKSGNYLASPLKYRYWNSLQNFSFTPNYASPHSMWAYSGGVKVNIGGAGSGVTADAPYYTTAGTNYNDHFNDSGNWIITEHT